ncbi:hypothetical protein F7725_009088 [Dissostichus mawsoni]|uniref:Uncharacterized protein n=1 Tax=Dissostichus mawsoni TaxID=36200 RepID=A0A7J5Z815_DISMA|nr:hypothetical protein F7725_009088 [Dissostichus mawsoni]
MLRITNLIDCQGNTAGCGRTHMAPTPTGLRRVLRKRPVTQPRPSAILTSSPPLPQKTSSSFQGPVLRGLGRAFSVGELITHAPDLRFLMNNIDRWGTTVLLLCMLPVGKSELQNHFALGLFVTPPQTQRQTQRQADGGPILFRAISSSPSSRLNNTYSLLLLLLLLHKNPLIPI